MTSRFNSPKYQRGIGMMEVLVTILVLAIGLLGLAGLQLASLKQNNQALQRSVATLDAYDLTDRIRANPIGVDFGWYNSPTATAVAACGTTSGCTPQQMAQNDFYSWLQQLASDLPSGKGFVCIDSAVDTAVDPTVGPSCDGSGDLYTIYITWTEISNGANQTKTFSTSFRP